MTHSDTFRQAGKVTNDTMVSGYVKGPAADSRKAFFEKWYKNKVQVIHFDQHAAWRQPVGIAAKINFTGMDAKNLYFYSCDKKTGKLTRIENPAYWIDKNGYLHFTTELGGDIIIIAQKPANAGFCAYCIRFIA